MKKFPIILLALAYFTVPFCISAIAENKIYKAKCIYQDREEDKSSFKSCEVKLMEKVIEINFKKEKYQSNNMEIIYANVSEIASGEYAKKLLSDTGSIVSGILLGPVNLITGIFVPNRDYQQYILNFQNDLGEETATIVNIDRSDAPEFQQELTLVTGKLISFREAQTSNTINIGPDI